MATPDGPAPIATVLRRVVQRAELEEALRPYRIWTFWDHEVGSAIARRAQPTDIRNGTLFVTVSTHSWMQELQYMKDDIRTRLNTRLGADCVRDICFSSGALPADERPAAAERIVSDSGEQEVILPDVADPELAAAFARIVAARRRRTRSPYAPPLTRAPPFRTPR